MRCYCPETLLDLGSDINRQEGHEICAVEAFPELLKTLTRAAGMTVDQIASGKSLLPRDIAKMRRGSQTLPKQGLNRSLSL